MTTQSEIPLEPECPGFDKCPVPMCGCRWLGTGLPWNCGAEREPGDTQAERSA